MTNKILTFIILIFTPVISTMKIEYKISSTKHIFWILTLVMWCWVIGSAPAEECLDLIADGREVTVDGGCYGIIFVKNDGRLTINGDTTAETLLLKWGTINLCGNWSVNDVWIQSGTVKIIPYSDSLKGSGTFFLECNQFIIEIDGLIDANGAGGDKQGIAGGQSSKGGGGYGGKGGKGGSGGDSGGKTYGDNFSLSIKMGSRGRGHDEPSQQRGGTGGGSISIISTGDVIIQGAIKTNGGNGRDANGGGGSGGGVLILSRKNLELIGTISANGGNGNSAGGGGGGRIKLFYNIGGSINDVASKLNVNGGTAERCSNCQSGENGTIFTNAIPKQPELIIPENGKILATQNLIFKFNIIDTSAETDNRDDNLSCIIELSTDNFATVYKTYDQNISLSGWSKFEYKSGDEAEFTPTKDLPEGVYQWRAAARDRSIRGDNSLVRSFTLGTPPTIELKASPSSLPPDGESTSLITATVTKDSELVTDEIVVMNLDGDGILSDVTNNGDGTYTATYTAGTTPGTVTITAAATNSNVSDIVELTLTGISQSIIYQTELSLTKGINIISLSLKPETPWTAKTIVQELGATLVIRAVDGNFKVYIDEGGVGEDLPDFPIEANKGYIVNVTKPVNYTLLGEPWGEPVVVAPSIEMENPTWAFAVTGVIKRRQNFRTPNIADIAKIVNLRTGESATAKIKPNGRFIATFVDFSRRSVVQVDDAIELSFTDRHGNLLSKIIRRIEPEHVERAYLNTVVELRPPKTALFQNYPNPFNPETWMPYQITQDTQVTIDIFNIAGELIRRIELGNQTAGWYVTKDRAAFWNGRNNTGEGVASGIYFYKLRAGNYSAVRKMLIAK